MRSEVESQAGNSEAQVAAVAPATVHLPQGVWCWTTTVVEEQAASDYPGATVFETVAVAKSLEFATGLSQSG